MTDNTAPTPEEVAADDPEWELDADDSIGDAEDPTRNDEGDAE